jgi:RNA polymerase subunit RPABC4/transcription elongation factor Spt4
MIEHEGDYCEQCGALWPEGQEACAGCDTRRENGDSTGGNPLH